VEDKKGGHMPRIARIVGIGLPHHLTQRGNYGQEIFLTTEDRQQYLLWVEEYSQRYGVSILAYCLMCNHVHFIVIPQQADSLAKTFNFAHMCYAQYLNKKLNRRGHLWQGRFYSCVLDERHLFAAARYIERNPVRAGLVEKAWQWPWSSALSHISANNQKPQLISLANLFNFIEITPQAWQEYLDSFENPTFLKEIRKHTSNGRPIGNLKSSKSLIINKSNINCPI